MIIEKWCVGSVYLCARHASLAPRSLAAAGATNVKSGTQAASQPNLLRSRCTRHDLAGKLCAPSKWPSLNDHSRATRYEYVRGQCRPDISESFLVSFTHARFPVRRRTSCM